MKPVAALVLGTLLAGAPPSRAAIPLPLTETRAAFLTFESGLLVGVNWVESTPTSVHTRSVMTQSMILDATIHIRPDGTATSASVSVTNAGGAPGKATERSFADSTVYWSDFIPSSVEQAVLRARVLGAPRVEIPAASLFSATRGWITVERVDSTDWVVSYHNKRYDVLTNERGEMIAATLPEYGVTIERRAVFPFRGYPLWPPDDPPPDRAYEAREVRIPAPQGHVLAGTLTAPRGLGDGRRAVPAAVLITGLSANNRNNGNPPWMPLRDIADALTRRGIAVLRVDDRGVEQSTGDRGPSTTLDEADDVATEVRWLRTRKGIDPRRIVLVGYSEGGLIAPIVASRDPSIAAIVTLAGPGVSGPDVARYQITAAVVRDTTIGPDQRESEIEKQLAEPMTPREQSYLRLDPLAFARKVRCPALLLQGGSDLTVPPRSAERLATAMRTAGNRDVSVRVFPGVSHSFTPDPAGLPSGWAMLPALHVAPDVLGTMGDWLAKRLIRL